jgi:heptose-I-phosphate ethanolaminephosphotransferase
LVNFQTIINQDVIDIIAETSLSEIQNFAVSYFSVKNVLITIFTLIGLNILVHGVARFFSKIAIIRKTILCIVLIGSIIYCYTIYNFVLYRNGMSIPQLTTITRIVYSSYIVNNRIKEIDNLIHVCKNVNATSIYEKGTPNIVLIIGESFSLYHSSLYNYELQTNPLLQNNNSLVVYNNAIAIDDHTHGVMKSIFSLSQLNNNFNNTPLFPACFKAAGYKVFIYDNQYFVGKGMTFLTHKCLSENICDFRNKNGYTYDHEMISDINISNEFPSLYIIHLNGQHYQYENKYPHEFEYFTPDNYSLEKYTDKQRKIVAHYDNATRYNDFVVNEIIEKFSNSNSCVIYLSDHGEEVYDIRDYMGHGNSFNSPDINYQIRIPLMIYTSQLFNEKHPSLVENFKKAKDYPITSDDISHVLLDIAGIKTEYFDKTRSFVNEKFNKERHRIVLNSIDFDAVTNFK